LFKTEQEGNQNKSIRTRFEDVGGQILW